ncbi:hypothetical protein RHMOL_Rhmol07G0265800 [Rhododendron molle]|uniref:Uncharacterized protein n=1 Tax=Rhododendron molle TaxID=49168 RepID=A0ACC0N578_RHOML|nr:hypothetical protein RHMOL_Rhmol07G0265800 [Rhododendron molle]
MATAAIETKQQPAPASSMEACSSTRAKQGEGLRQYYLQHIHDLQLEVRQKSHNLSRLEAERNDLNSKGMNFVVLLLRKDVLQALRWKLDISATFAVDEAALEGTFEADVGYNCSTAGASVRPCHCF